MFTVPLFILLYIAKIQDVLYILDGGHFGYIGNFGWSGRKTLTPVWFLFSRRS